MNDRIELLRAEYRVDSAFVATSRPRLSWVVETDSDNWVQQAVELRLDGTTTVYLEGAANVLVPWPFAPLADQQLHRIEARSLSGTGQWSPWCNPLDIRSAVVEAWAAPYIGLAEPQQPAQPVLLSSTAQIGTGLIVAILHVSALGSASVEIDGIGVDDAVLAPGWTSYDRRVLHDSIDVLEQLKDPGEHSMSIELCGAWYTEEYGFGPEGRRIYGDQPAVAVELHLRYADGQEKILRTGEHWKATGAGQLVSSGIYAGETRDLTRCPPPEQQRPNAQTLHTGIVPLPRISEPVRRVAELEPVTIQRLADGTHALDFGQNLVGRLRLNVAGTHGQTITIRHAEVLENGRLALRPLRRAAASDRFILDGAQRTLEPQGTFHGFRYAEISGWPGELRPADVRAIVLQSDMRRTAWFDSSHELLNRLHENVVWSMKGNFLSVPTDCPQRDERMGWTGDAQVFAPTASTLFDCNGFFVNWLQDLNIEQQRHHGVVPFIVPDVLRFPAGPNAAWGDAATVIPTVLFDRFVDEQTLRAQLPSMKAWLEAIIPHVDESGLWEDHMQFGDWLDPDAPPEIPGLAKTPSGVVATAYLFRSADLVARAASRFGDEVTAKRYRGIAERTREAFTGAYITALGRMTADAPTAYALAISFGIVTDAGLKQRLGDRLAHISRANGFYIATGFVGTPIILDALVDTGHVETAERLLLQTGSPSWLYPVTMGATTSWERWDSLLPDGSINPGEMTSFNHYAFGAIVDWMYRRLAGITPTEPGYRRFSFAPVPLSGLEYASATVDTPAGRISAQWRRGKEQMHFELTVPAHARAEITLPDGTRTEVGSGVHTWTSALPAGTVLPVEPSLGSSFREIADDQESLAAVQGILRNQDPETAEILRRRINWNLLDPLPAGLFDVPPSVLHEIAGALEGIAAVRRAR